MPHCVVSLDLIHSKKFRGVYKKYLDSMKQGNSADTATGELSRRHFVSGPVRKVYVKDARSNKGHHHHKHYKHHHKHHRDQHRDQHRDHQKQKSSKNCAQPHFVLAIFYYFIFYALTIRAN